MLETLDGRLPGDPDASPKQLDESTRARIRAAQLGAIIRFTPLTMVVNLANIALVTYTLADVVAPIGLALWGVLIGGIAMLGLRSALARRARPSRGMVSARTFRRAAVHAGVLAAAWGALPLVWFPHIPGDAQLVVATVVTGMICAGGFVLATVPPAATTYVVVLSLGSLGGIVQSGSSYRWILAGLLLAYASVVLRSALGTARLFLDRYMAEIDLAERGQVIALLLAEFEENGSDWLFELDRELRIVKHSSRFADVSHRRGRTLNGVALLELIAPDDRAALLARVGTGRPFRNLEVAAHGLQGERWWSFSASPIVDERGELVGWRGVGSDVTDVRRAKDEIAWMARTDILTGLRNRSAFRERAAEALIAARAHGVPMAIACLDLDYFKAVNDTLGHPAGDALLREVADELLAFEDEGIAVGRLGGDEFGLLFEGHRDIEAVYRHSDEIIRRVARSYDIQGTRVSVGASMGIACGPDDGTTVDELIRNADLALYRSKDAARGTATRYSTLMLREAEERRTVKEDLALALAREEFVLHYQPIIDITTGNTVAFEALVRWQHPTRGLLPPDAFIAIAEASGLIIPLGDWILREACRQAATWPARLHVAVNLSPAQLGRAAQRDSVVDALAAAGIAPNRLEFEITEALFLTKDEGTLRFLADMRGLGIGIALDDFGSGFSSLNYLTTYPVTKIKIDRSFVSGGASIAHRGAIIEAVTLLARSLGCVTTAEGVESGGALAWVSSLGCTQAQGYLFAHPMPARDIPAYLARERVTPPGVAAIEQVGLPLPL